MHDKNQFFRENGHKNREKNGIRLRMSFFFRKFAPDFEK